MCYPQWPDAGTQDGRSRSPLLIPGRCHPLRSDSRAASSSGRSLESGAGDTLESSGQDPAGAAGSSP